MRSQNATMGQPSSGAERTPGQFAPGSTAMGQGRLCSHCLKVTFERHDYKCLHCEGNREQEEREQQRKQQYLSSSMQHRQQINAAQSPAYSGSSYKAATYSGAANPPRIQGQQPIAGRQGGVGARSNQPNHQVAGQDNYNAARYYGQPQPQPSREPRPDELEDDDKFERRGDYYQCVKCEHYTVHYKNDKYCENHNCPSNSNIKYTNK